MALPEDVALRSLEVVVHLQVSIGPSLFSSFYPSYAFPRLFISKLSSFSIRPRFWPLFLQGAAEIAIQIPSFWFCLRLALFEAIAGRPFPPIVKYLFYFPSLDPHPPGRSPLHEFNFFLVPGFAGSAKDFSCFPVPAKRYFFPSPPWATSVSILHLNFFHHNTLFEMGSFLHFPALFAIRLNLLFRARGVLLQILRPPILFLLFSPRIYDYPLP